MHKSPFSFQQDSNIDIQKEGFFFPHMVMTIKPQSHSSKIQLQVYTLSNTSQIGSRSISLKKKKKKDTMLINLIAFIDEKQILKCLHFMFSIMKLQLTVQQQEVLQCLRTYRGLRWKTKLPKFPWVNFLLESLSEKNRGYQI